MLWLVVPIGIDVIPVDATRIIYRVKDIIKDPHIPPKSIHIIGVSYYLVMLNKASRSFCDNTVSTGSYNIICYIDVARI